MSGRAPDLILKGFNKNTDERTGELGVGWTNDNKSITLILRPFITLQRLEGWSFTLFPNVPYDQRAGATRKAGTVPQSQESSDDDQTPF